MKKIHTIISLISSLCALSSCEYSDIFNRMSFESATPLLSSISLFHEDDYLRCEEQLNRAIDLNNKGINFVINQYATIDLKSNSPINYCYMKKDKSCPQMTRKSLLEFKDHLKDCFRIVKDKGLELTILPHIDDKNHSVWRNEMRFSPMQKFAGFSYKEVLLDPIIESLKEIGFDSSLLNFNLQGEMGATLFEHANQYEIIRKHYKEIMPEAKIGISLNYNFIDGNVKFNPYKDCSGKWVTKPHHVKNSFKLNPLKKRQLQELITNSNYIGFSAYKAISPKLNPQDFENAIWDFKKELQSHGLSFSKNKEIHFSEIGLGGGAKCYDGINPASSYKEALESPYSGIQTSYVEQTNPWRNEEVRKARFDYYMTLGKYLIKTKKFNLTRAYLWNVSSWDFQGIYPGSENYMDNELIELTKAYNFKTDL